MDQNSGHFSKISYQERINFKFNYDFNYDLIMIFTLSLGSPLQSPPLVTATALNLFEYAMFALKELLSNINEKVYKHFGSCSRASSFC